jgi:hypothetical protein
MAKTESENDAVKSRSTAALFSTAEAIDPNALPPIDRRTEGLASDSKATPFFGLSYREISPRPRRNSPMMWNGA